MLVSRRNQYLVRKIPLFLVSPAWRSATRRKNENQKKGKSDAVSEYFSITARRASLSARNEVNFRGEARLHNRGRHWVEVRSIWINASIDISLWLRIRTRNKLEKSLSRDIPAPFRVYVNLALVQNVIHAAGNARDTALSCNIPLIY